MGIRLRRRKVSIFPFEREGEGEEEMVSNASNRVELTRLSFFVGVGADSVSAYTTCPLQLVLKLAPLRSFHSLLFSLPPIPRFVETHPSSFVPSPSHHRGRRPPRRIGTLLPYGPTREVLGGEARAGCLVELGVWVGGCAGRRGGDQVSLV